MQDICVTATRDHNVYASFRPSIATKDAETRSKMNTADVIYGDAVGDLSFTDAFKL